MIHLSAFVDSILALLQPTPEFFNSIDPEQTCDPEQACVEGWSFAYNLPVMSRGQASIRTFL